MNGPRCTANTHAHGTIHFGSPMLFAGRTGRNPSFVCLSVEKAWYLPISLSISSGCVGGTASTFCDVRSPSTADSAFITADAVVPMPTHFQSPSETMEAQAEAKHSNTEDSARVRLAFFQTATQIGLPVWATPCIRTIDHMHPSFFCHRLH
jgi:hypothetical protein